MNRVGSHALSTKGWEVVFGRKEYNSCGMASASTVRNEWKTLIALMMVCFECFSLYNLL